MEEEEGDRGFPLSSFPPCKVPIAQLRLGHLDYGPLRYHPMPSAYYELPVASPVARALGHDLCDAPPMLMNIPYIASTRDVVNEVVRALLLPASFPTTRQRASHDDARLTIS